MATRITDLRTKVRPIAQHWVDGGFSMTDILSIGLLFLADKDANQIADLRRIVNEINPLPNRVSLADESKQSARTARVEAIKKIVSTMTQPGYKILSQEESTALDELRKALGPEKKELSAKKAKNA
jgi:hypothetical protein